MSDHAIEDFVVEHPVASLRLRTGIALAFLAVSAMACLVAGGFLIARARGESAQIVQRAQNQVSNLSFKFDQEITAVKFLLKGLSTSPALLSGNLKSLYDQLKATDVPDGTWLLFQDMEKQLINTRLPFGSELPRHTYFPNYKEILDHIRSRRWTVSERKKGPATGNIIIGLNLRIDDSNGQMSHILTSIISEARLASILNDQNVPEDWTKALYDKNVQPIVAAIGQRTGVEIPAPLNLAARIERLPRQDSSEGVYSDQDARGQPVLVAYRFSDATNWTTILGVPLATVNQPLNSAFWQITWLSLVVLVTGGFAALLTARRMEAPLDILEGIVTSSTKQIGELSTQLLALQEEERQRIARELHDSTAQHLVAASIGMMNLSRKSDRSENESRLIEQIEDLIDKSLKELRIFTYLLHPPDLERNGLQATLRDFSEGFARRTGLIARLRIPEEVDALPHDIQWSILRVAQEAFANAHRHAEATRIVLNIRMGASRLVMQIRDDGRGIQPAGLGDPQVKLGVGIPGMRARLKQFGGDLRIRTGPEGTTLVAAVPLPQMGRISFVARRPADAFSPLKTKATHVTRH